MQNLEHPTEVVAAQDQPRGPIVHLQAGHPHPIAVARLPEVAQAVILPAVAAHEALTHPVVVAAHEALTQEADHQALVPAQEVHPVAHEAVAHDDKKPGLLKENRSQV